MVSIDQLFAHQRFKINTDKSNYGCDVKIRISDVLATAHNQINTASSTLEKLRTTRTSVMQRKVKYVEKITGIESNETLKLSEENITVDE